MSHRNHALVISRPVPHCTESGCLKCIAQSHWLRRKAWRCNKTEIRLRRGRK
jgi:hypothetical protein